ncbi:MAG: N-acetyl-alpha-D-glucosaminyl L-malate synthase BshA [Myxococcota bacterium]
MSGRELGVVLACPPSFGGSAVVASELGEALLAEGARVELVSAQRPPRLRAVTHRTVRAPDYPVFGTVPSTVALAGAIADAVDAVQANVVHAHYALPNAIAALLGAQMARVRPRVVVTLHGTDVIGVGAEPDYKRAVRDSLSRADAVTAVSESLKGRALDAFDLPADAIAVVPNFTAVRSAASPANSKALLHISNCREVKRSASALEAFARLRERADATLLFVGDGPQRKAIEARAAELGVAESTEFIGELAEPGEVIQRARALIVTSRYESFSMAALEAMGHGVPVVATGVGGLPEVVKHGEGGLLGDESPASLDPLLQKLWSDDALVTRLGESARARVRDVFDAATVTSAYRAIYEPA